MNFDFSTAYTGFKEAVTKNPFIANIAEITSPAGEKKLIEIFKKSEAALKEGCTVQDLLDGGRVSYDEYRRETNGWFSILAWLIWIHKFFSDKFQKKEALITESYTDWKTKMEIANERITIEKTWPIFKSSTDSCQAFINDVKVFRRNHDDEYKKITIPTHAYLFTNGPEKKRLVNSLHIPTELSSQKTQPESNG